MKRFLIIDTCVWIGLAGEPKLYSLLETFRETIEGTDFILVLPESVRIEFNRHRNKIKADWQNKCKGWISRLKEIGRHFPDHLEELSEVHNNIQNTLARLDSNVEDNLKLVDYLFEKAILIENCSDLILAEAARRVFHRIPPALNSKSSSVGDCLLWLSVLEVLKDGEVWFCTDNRHDFSKKDCGYVPHEALDEEAFRANTKGNFNYFIDPNKLIERIAPIVERLPKYSEYVDYGLPPYLRHELDRDSWMQPVACPKCKTGSAFPQLYSTGYRYVCTKCGMGSELIPSDDPFL